jgi:hypothetical protein
MEVVWKEAVVAYKTFLAYFEYWIWGKDIFLSLKHANWL